MTQQETVERDVRITIGDLHLQLIVARAQIADLQRQLAEILPPPVAPPELPKGKVNGKDHRPNDPPGAA